MKDSEAMVLEDDARLAVRIRARDEDAIRDVVHTYLPELLRAARGAGLSLEQAEDVVQGTFATFVEVASRFEGRSHVRTFLFGILYKKIAEARRAERRESRVGPIEEEIQSRFREDGTWLRPPRPIDLQLYDSEIREAIEQCLQNVSLQQRMAFLLRDAAGFSTQETCNILDVSRTNLGVLLYRARNRLRTCLESRGMKG